MVKTCVDKIIDECLADQDSGTREIAATLLGTVAEDVLNSENTMAKIAKLLESEEPGSQCAAAQALGHLGAKAAPKWASKLESLLSNESEDTSSRSLQMGGGSARSPAFMRKPMCAAMSALGMMGASTYAGAIAVKLNSTDWEVRLCALQSLAAMGDAAKGQSDSVAEVLADAVHLNRAEACKTLAALEAEETAEGIADLLKDKSPLVRMAAAASICQLGSDGAVFSNGVFKLFKDPIKAVRAAAISSIGNMGETGECYAGPIAGFLLDSSLLVRCASLEALGKLGSRGAAFAEEVAMYLEDPTPMARSAAINALGQMGEEAAPFAAKIQALTEDPYVAKAAKEAVEAIAA